MDVSVFNLALQVEQMRNAQKHYYENGGDERFAGTEVQFQLCQIQNVVDDSVKEILKAEDFANTSEELILENTAHSIQALRANLLDNHGLFGGGHKMNKIFSYLNKAHDVASGKEVSNES